MRPAVRRAGARSTSLARLRLVTFLAAVAALVWWLGFGGGVPAAGGGGGLLLALARLSSSMRGSRSAPRGFEACVVNVRGVAKLDRDWDALPAAPAPPDGLEGHPYAVDLDLFGRASLFQWIGPATTDVRCRHARQWLLHPAAPAEILSRQAAVASCRVSTTGANGWPRSACWRRFAAPNRSPRFGVGGEPGPGDARPTPRIKVAVYVIVAALWLLLAALQRPLAQ